MTFPLTPPERLDTNLTFALLLRDRLSLTDRLLGKVGVTGAGRTAYQREAGGGTFLFVKLPDGPVTLEARSDLDTPYYRPADIAVSLPAPNPRWPAFPDISLADKTKLLADPGQPAAYRAQFLQACLLPAIAYPFDPGTTLLRGTVLQAGAPLADATVSDTGGLSPAYVTDDSGQFVLVFPMPSGPTQAINVRVQRAGQPDVTIPATLRRAAAVAMQIDV